MEATNIETTNTEIWFVDMADRPLWADNTASVNRRETRGLRGFYEEDNTEVRIKYG
jgi:hypothetical protein